MSKDNKLKKARYVSEMQLKTGNTSTFKGHCTDDDCPYTTEKIVNSFSSVKFITFHNSVNWLINIP